MEIGEKYFLAQETSLDLTKNKVNVITGYLGSASITDIITGESVADTIDFGLQETVEEILSKLNTIPKISDFSGQSVSPASSSLETTTNNYNVKVNEGFYNTESTISIPNATFVNDLGIRSEVIAEGNSIAGVEGTFMGSTGNATAAQVLDGYTFSNSEEKGIEGTMPDFSTNNATTTAKNSTFSSGVTGAVYAKPTEEGFYTSDTQIKVPITNLKAENIKKGVNIGGIIGTLEAMSTFNLELKTGTTTGNISNRDRNMGGSRNSAYACHVDPVSLTSSPPYGVIFWIYKIVDSSGRSWTDVTNFYGDSDSCGSSFAVAVTGGSGGGYSSSHKNLYRISDSLTVRDLNWWYESSGAPSGRPPEGTATVYYAYLMPTWKFRFGKNSTVYGKPYGTALPKI